MAITLIVMEPGSEWPGHVRGAEDIVALGMGDGSLLVKIRARLASLRLRGQHVRLAVLACSGAVGSSAIQQRADVAGELLTAVMAAGLGRLVLSAADDASMPLRCELLSLAGALSERIEGTTTTVYVKFGAVDRVDRREHARADRAGSEQFARALRRPKAMTG